VTIDPDFADGGSWQATYWLGPDSCHGDSLMSGNGYAGTCADPPYGYPLTCDVPTNAVPGLNYIRTETNNHNAGYYLSFTVTLATNATPTNPAP
jgi:hypothetical protein